MNERESTGVGAVVADSVETMVRLPLQMTEATMDAVVQGVRWMTGSTHMSTAETTSRADESDSNASNFHVSGGTSERSSRSSGPAGSSMLGGDTDLSGDDLKYIVWSIVFTKPGFEAVLQPQQDDLVSYSADTSTYAASKIAGFLEGARDGHITQPGRWAELNYPPDRRDQPNPETQASQVAGSQQSQQRGAWRIPSEDHKYIAFLYRVERRLPKPEPDVVRVERVTVEQRV